MGLFVLGLLCFFLITVDEIKAQGPMHRYSADDIDEDGAKEIVHCLGQIICEAKEPEAFQVLEEAAANCPDLIATVKGFVKDIYGTDDFYAEGTNVICPIPKPERMSKFMEFAEKVGEDFQENECEHEETPRCDCYHLGLKAGEEMVQDYTDRGICTSPEGAMKEGAEQGKNMGGEMADRNPMG